MLFWKKRSSRSTSVGELLNEIKELREANTTQVCKIGVLQTQLKGYLKGNKQVVTLEQIEHGQILYLEDKHGLLGKRVVVCLNGKWALFPFSDSDLLDKNSVPLGHTNKMGWVETKEEVLKYCSNVPTYFWIKEDKV